ncbi:response regulator [Flavobacterium wongokense]|uniref:response regulator n=1 Tax=Flavobacterium wongokense TaxID=2910674 RepID=UPI001F2240C6|nr:response regulator [Flavobacterium sp. WG47]MCF6132038.1 response regulator [Flavobacterium sp. WG47]
MQITQTIVNRDFPSYLSLIYQSANTCFQQSFFKKKPIQADYDLKGNSILVIDNNLTNPIIIKMITKKWMNVNVDFASNGKEGLKKLSRNAYDIILMDLEMPVMDGYETTMAIRRGKAYENYKSIPIIDLSTDISKSTNERVLEIGINKHLAKPVNEKMLFECISSLVNA